MNGESKNVKDCCMILVYEHKDNIIMCFELSFSFGILVDITVKKYFLKICVQCVSVNYPGVCVGQPAGGLTMGVKVA